MNDHQITLIALIVCMIAGTFDGLLVAATSGRKPVWVFFSGAMLVLSILLAARLYMVLA